MAFDAAHVDFRIVDDCRQPNHVHEWIGGQSACSTLVHPQVGFRFFAFALSSANTFHFQATSKRCNEMVFVQVAYVE